MGDPSDSTTHVHFSEVQASEHDANIIVKPGAGGVTEVHLGFLALKHKYSIKFTIEHELGSQVTAKPSNPEFVTIVNCEREGDGHEIELTLVTHKEKLLEEKIDLIGKRETLPIKLVSRVLPKGKGKPTLRRNIHLISKQKEDSE